MRAAELPDTFAIQVVACDTWQATYAGIIPDDVQRRLLDAWYSPAALERALRATDSVFLVATSLEEVLGFAQFVRRSAESAELTRIYVLPEHHRKGIGRGLLDAGLERLRTMGVGILTVAVERENDVGRRFYRRTGFAEVGERRVDLHGHSLALVEYRRLV